jgi:ATP-dependent helicase/nuclease subunit B
LTPLPQAARTFEFWLGRAGSGKTYACLDSIAGHLIERPRGEPLILLVPEQASASTEHALALHMEARRAGGDPDAPRGFTRARVLSFRLLQEEVFARTGGRPDRIVDEHARILLLRRAIRRRRDELKIFGTSAELPGLAASMSRAIAEFQRFGWRADDVRERLAALAAGDAGHEVLRRKLSDLAVIWESYRDLLEELDYADLPARGEAAARRIADWDALRGARIWIDGFASFNEEELRLIDALLNQAAWGCLALCLDPYDPAFVRLADPAAAIAVPGRRVGPQRAFETLEQTYLQVRARLREAGWHTRDQELPRTDIPTRLASTPALEALEADVLTSLRGPAGKNAGWPAARHGETWPSGPIELLEAPDRRAEVEAVARRLAALCSDRAGQGKGRAAFDPSETIVLVRELEPYAPLIREIFPRYGIPFFLDATRLLHRHPLSRLLLTALRHARFGGWTTELALDYLKTGLVPDVDPDFVAALERLAARRRLQHRDWKHDDHWAGASEKHDPAEQRRIRTLFDRWRRAAEPVERLHEALKQPEADVAAALSRFLVGMDAGGRIDAWIEACRRDGDEEMASIHERAIASVEALLERLHEIGARGAATDDASAAERIDELEEILEAALQTVRGRLIPPSQEQVIVGQIDRSRTPPRVRAAFVMGLVDGEFPRAYDEDPILGDRERRTLAEGAHPVGPDSADRFSMERFFAYIALTRPSELLVATRPLQDDQGRSLQPSAPFLAVAHAFPAAGPLSTEADASEGAGDLPERPEIWTSRLTRDFHRAALGDAPALARLTAAKHPLDVLPPGESVARARVAQTLAALNWPGDAGLSAELSRAFWSTRPQLSATGLEDYGACPFKFFASRMLRLERPLDLTPGPLELGELRHKLLEELFRSLGRGAPLDWGRVDVPAATRLVDEIAPQIARDTLEDRFGRDALTEVLLADAVEDIKAFVLVLKRMGERYGFVQVDAEYDFGPHRHEPLTLPVAEGLAFTLRGSVDRVDADADGLRHGRPRLVLYDFKSGANAAQHGAPRYYHGLSLQLAVYGLALRRHFEWKSESGESRTQAARVSGFFYWPLSLGVARESAADPADAASDAWFKTHSAKGLFDAAIAHDLDTEVEPGSKALAFGFSLKKDGTLARTGFGPLENGGFDRYLDHVHAVIAARAQRLAEGSIPVAPIAAPFRACDLCDHAAVCRIATCGPAAFRFLPAVTSRDFRERFEAAELPEVMR